MKMRIFFTALLLLITGLVNSQSPSKDPHGKNPEKITETEIEEYCRILTSADFEGRLSGSPGFWKSANFIAGKMEEWGIQPAVDNMSFFQVFPSPYTEVLDAGTVTIESLTGSWSQNYHFPGDYYPGSNTASGTIKGEAVYLGYGISAPELGYDDYAGIDVTGKILVFEPGLPVNPAHPDYQKWVPYSYHRKKFSDALEKGALGLLYADKIVNPNTSYLEGFVYAHAGPDMIEDLFKNTGTSLEVLRKKINDDLLPHSIPLGNTVTLSATSRHFPDTEACNVIGIIPGSDPVLRNEVIIIGGHFDGQGKLADLIFPGALDNASGVANILAAARAISQSGLSVGRTIMFLFIGGEENGLLGSSHYVQNPLFPRENTLIFFNLDMVGNGTGIGVYGGQSHPEIMRHFENNNQTGRTLTSSPVRQVTGRPRSDSAIFQLAGFKALGIGTPGRVKEIYYHNHRDDMEALTIDVMRDVAELIFLSLIDMSNDRNISPD